MSSDEDFIFVHIPKTAGQSIKKMLFGRTGGPHRSIFEINNDQEKPFSFAFVRNPWDRLYSSFCYLSNGGSGNNTDRLLNEQFFQNYKEDFRSFVIEGLDSNTKESVIHLKDQSSFICNESGEIMVDFVGRFENLNEDVRKLKEHLGITNQERQLQKLNPSKRNRDYRSVYDKEMMEKVFSLYRKDIDIFDYTF